LFAQRTNWPAAPNRLAAALERRRAAGERLLDLSESNPTRCGLGWPARELAAVLAEADSSRYDPQPFGLASAREAVSEYYAERGARVPPERILLTTGSSEAYSFLFRLLAEPGDEILTPAPSYPLLDLLADVNDVRLVRYPLAYEAGWRMDLDALREAVTPRSRAIVMVSPNNPTGSFVHAEELDGLAGLARERRLALIADEVFRDFSWGPEPAGPSLAGEDRCLTFALNGLSKTAALPQMKLGWMAIGGPDELARQALARLEVLADIYLSVGTTVQQAAPRLLAGGEPVRQRVLRRVSGNRAWLDGRLRGSAVRRLVAEGGWYAVLRAPAVLTAEEWALRLLDRGVLVHPGHFFDFPAEAYLALSLIAEPEIFHEGADILLDVAEREA